jgi:hypothetical protein
VDISALNWLHPLLSMIALKYGNNCFGVAGAERKESCPSAIPSGKGWWKEDTEGMKNKLVVRLLN